MGAKLAGVSFVHGDATTPQHLHLLQDATHIYLFDKVFSEENHAVLLPICPWNSTHTHKEDLAASGASGTHGLIDWFVLTRLCIPVQYLDCMVEC
jgi:hypothetical protein